MRLRFVWLCLCLAFGRFAAASTAVPQILLGVPQPVTGQNFAVSVLVEAQGDATPIATGSVTINWGDNTTPTVATLSDSLVIAEHSYSVTAAYQITATYGGDANYSGVSATQQAISLASAPAAVTLRTWGDSITYGVGATSSSYDFASLTATDEGWSLANYGVAGDDSVDTCEYINAASPLPANAYNTLLTGANDLRHAMTSTAGEMEYINAVAACSIWLATTQGSNRITAASSANTTTGTWTPSTLYTKTGLNSTVAGSSISGSFTGNVFYGQLTSTATSNYQVSISIDGGTATTYTPPVQNYAGARVAFGPYLVRIPLTGASSAAHTVTFTCVSPGTTGCYVDWFAGNGLVTAGSPPYLWLGTPYYTAQPGYPESEYAQMAQYVRQIQAQLAADGLQVYLADTYNWFQLQTIPACAYDQIHPANCGHEILAATFINSMNVLLADVPQVQLSTAGKHNFGYVAIGLSEPYGVQITNATTVGQPMNIVLSGPAQFTQVNNCGTSLAAGHNCEVVFTYAPSAQETGLQTATWSLSGLSTGVLPQNGGTLLGQGEPSTALLLNATAHNFGAVAKGSQGTSFGLILANPASTAFSGTLAIAGATGQFAIQNGCTLPIAAYGNCVILVNFSPTTTGPQTVTVTVTPTRGESVTPGNVVTFTGTGTN